MLNLDSNYIKLVYEGIKPTDNLPDLNDMTDRGQNPLKPFTSAKTVSTMGLIKKHNPQSEDELLNLFQKHSKKKIEVITDEVYEHQKAYFGNYKYTKETIFKYCYCCIVLNSLKGNSTELRFDSWFSQKNRRTRVPKNILDSVFHTDRIELNEEDRAITFISIKPASFYHNFEQYVDVFEGLQFLSRRFGRPWVIYYENPQSQSFSSITYDSLSPTMKQHLEQNQGYYNQTKLDQKLESLY